MGVAKNALILRSAPQERVTKDEVPGALMGAWLYILRCADGSYYTGTTRSDLFSRLAQHQAGTFGGFTASRLPVALVHSEWFDRITDAIRAERKIKGWSRAKKEALLRQDVASLRTLSKRRPRR